ncbi:MAG: ABC transporter substrate-binding protein, partial [Aestuariivirgaceae bacterium]
SPVGTAHAYDLVHLLKKAIEKAGTIDRRAVRTAFEQLERHKGLVRVYDPPFTPARHDALDISDFRLCRYGPDGSIIPVSMAAN